jgi:predicted  nucleic acid-binding Zn-ribbon protein
MSVASRLHQLQVADLEIREKRRSLQDITSRLEHSEAVASAETELSALESRLTAARGNQRQLEYDVDDVTAKVRDLNNRLYGGSVHNPKELISLQQEIDSIKKHLSQKEEALLDAMGALEAMEAEADTLRSRAAGLREEWDRQKEGLSAERSTVESALARLLEVRQSARLELGDEVSRLYDQLAQTKGVAVVQVEQGRCRGCNLTVPTGLWQRARAGEMVQCVSCGRILHVD